jgi:hypothetical protein
VDTALADLKEQQAALRSLEASGSPLAKLRSETEECNKAISTCYNTLGDALSGLDRSQFANGNDWVGSLSNPWDEFANAINGAYSPLNPGPESIKTAISRAVARLDAMIDTVQQRLDAEVKRYTES